MPTNKQDLTEIRDYLFSRVGIPTNIQDIQSHFEEQGRVLDEDTVSGYLNYLTNYGIVYPYSRYWYLTQPGFEQAENNKRLRSEHDRYNPMRDSHQGLNFKSRRSPEHAEKLAEWTQYMQGYYDRLRQNHPELAELFKYILHDKSINFNIYHDPAEFVKDVQAIFHKWNFLDPDTMKDPMLTGLYPGETEYNVPDNMMSLEHAISESLQRLLKHSERHRNLGTTPENYRAGLDVIDQIIADSGQFLKDTLTAIDSEASPGVLLHFENLKRRIYTYLRDKNVANVVSSEMVGDVISRWAKTINSDNDLPEFKNIIFVLPNNLNANIQQSIRVLQNNENKGQVLNKMRVTTSNNSDYISILNGVFQSNVNWNGANFAEGKFDDLTLDGANLGGCNLSKTSWAGTTLTNCNLDGADFTGANFSNVDLVSNNSIEGTIFTNAIITGSVDKFKNNYGAPIGVSINDATNIYDIDSRYENEIGQEDQYFHPSWNTAIPIIDSERPYLQLVLNALESLVSRFYNTAQSSLYHQAKLTDDILEQLREFAIDKTKIPTFDYGDSLSGWLKEKAKNRELGELGKLQGKAIGNAIQYDQEVGNIKQHIEVSKEELLKTDPLKVPEIEAVYSQFLSKYETANSREELNISLADLHGLFLADLPLLANNHSTYAEERRTSYFAMWLDTKTYETGTLTYNDLLDIVHVLQNSLSKNYYRDSAEMDSTVQVVPKSDYNSFPYQSYNSDLRNTQHGVSGAGEQFGIALSPIQDANQDFISSEIMTQALEAAIDHTGTHLHDAICFARLFPLRITMSTDLNASAEDMKDVWVISEMQSDMYQKLGKEMDKAVFKDLVGAFPKVPKAKIKQVIYNIRSYYNHWPMNLLAEILLQAHTAGIKEVWMPQAIDVEAKTNSGKTHLTSSDVPNWTPSYDRPAKKFGGELQSTGLEITLDPGSSYQRKATDFYVIKVDSVVVDRSQKTASRFLYKTAELSQDIKQKFDHHLKWVIEHNRPQFPYVESYVTDEMIAQFAYGTFFNEYGITKTPQLAHELEDYIQDKYSFEIWSPPYIDWLGELNHAYDDAIRFARNNIDASPDLNVSINELIRDWFNDWKQKSAGDAYKQASWFPLLENTIRDMFQDMGYGDILSNDYNVPDGNTLDLLFNPNNPDDQDGGEFVDREGNPIPDLGWDNEIPQNQSIVDLNFGETQEELTNDLLDAYQRAKDAGDNAEMSRILQQLEEIQSLSSLKFR